MDRSRCLLLILAIVAGACVRPAAPPAARAPAEFEPPSVLFSDCFFVELDVNGSPCWFLLDTGANVSAIDTATAARLELPRLGGTSVTGTLGTIQVDQVRIDHVAAGGIEARDLRATCSDLSGSLAPPGKRLDGILGYDFLHDLRVTLDFAKASVRFAAGSESGASPAGWVAIPFVLDDGIPLFAATIDGLTAPLRLDTGASLFDTQDVYVNVTEEYRARLSVIKPRLAVVATLSATGAGGTSSLEVVRAERLALGSEAVVDRPFLIVQPARGVFATPGCPGFFANNLLKRYGRARIDFPARTLLLAPKPDADSSPNHR